MSKLDISKNLTITAKGVEQLSVEKRSPKYVPTENRVGRIVLPPAKTNVDAPENQSAALPKLQYEGRRYPPSLVGWNGCYDKQTNTLTLEIPEAFQNAIELPGHNGTWHCIESITGDPDVVAHFVYTMLLHPIQKGYVNEARTSMGYKELIAARRSFDQFLLSNMAPLMPCYLSTRVDDYYDDLNGNKVLNLHKLLNHDHLRTYTVAAAPLTLGVVPDGSECTETWCDYRWPHDGRPIEILPRGIDPASLTDLPVQHFFVGEEGHVPYNDPDCLTNVKVGTQGLIGGGLYRDASEGLGVIRKMLAQFGNELPSAFDVDTHWTKAFAMNDNGVFSFQPTRGGFGQGLVLYSRNEGAPSTGKDGGYKPKVDENAEVYNKNNREALRALPPGIYMMVRNKVAYKTKTTARVPDKNKGEDPSSAEMVYVDRWQEVVRGRGHAALVIKWTQDGKWDEIAFDVDDYGRLVASYSGSGSLNDIGCTRETTGHYGVVLVGLPKTRVVLGRTDDPEDTQAYVPHAPAPQTETILENLPTEFNPDYFLNRPDGVFY